MNCLTKILIQLGWIEITSFKVKRWVDEKNIMLLKLTLLKGKYPERIQAINGLVFLRETSAIPLLLKIGRKDFEVVAKVVIEAISKLDIEALYVQEVEGLKEFWEIKNQKSKRHKLYQKPEWMNKKIRMKNLEKVRQQLRKRMG